MTPSVLKGFFTVFLLILATTHVKSQYQKWEFGVGLRPLTLKEEPYSLMMKRFLSKGVALRFGLSAMYSEKETNHSGYHFDHGDSNYEFTYEYKLVDKNLYTTAFAGIQYGKRKHDFYWYGATDFSFKYKSENSFVPSILYRTNNVRVGDFLQIENYHQDKTIVLSVRQSVGIQYHINNRISVVLEGGAFFDKIFLTRNTCTSNSGVAIIGTRPVGIGAYGCTFELGKKFENYALNISPLTMITFDYSF